MAAVTLVALLRGINVGTAKRVAMADLKAAVESLGFGDVRTLLNSGNVVFTAAKAPAADPSARIGKAVLARTGVSARVLVRSARELSAVIAANPLAAACDNPSRLMVSFLADPKDKTKLAALARADWGRERFALGPGAAYVWCPDGLLESKAQAALAKALGDLVTTRNWATVLKLEVMTR